MKSERSLIVADSMVLVQVRASFLIIPIAADNVDRRACWIGDVGRKALRNHLKQVNIKYGFFV